MARRDVRRHRGRSIVVLLMVGIPTALLVFGLTLYATSTITGTERIPSELGSAQASVTTPQPKAVVQTPDPWNGQSESEAAARPIPGYSTEGALDAQTTAIARLVGGTAVPVREAYGRADIGGAHPHVSILVADGRLGFGDKLRLANGRWPARDDEVLVTPAGRHLGLPSHGTVTLAVSGSNHTATVVGTAAVPDGYTDVVSLTPFATSYTGSTTWLIKRAHPVTYAETLRLNEYGLVVTSADVLRHPPSGDQVPPAVAALSVDSGTNGMIVVAGGAMLLIITTLLVGPAFAVAAARQRRTLALLAANGAETRQVRATVLAQAVVLGVLAALGGALLGIAAAALLTDVILPTWRPDAVMGPFQVPVRQVAGIVAVAMLSSVIAALVPARRLGRLDIVGVIRGQSVSPSVSRVLPLFGLVVAAVGGAVLFWAVTTQQHEVPVVVGAIALILGSLLLVPMALVAAARLSSPFPVSVRLALRDAARQRTRSAPSVAAILGAVAALTMLLIGLTSDTTQAEHDYVPQAVMGEGNVSLRVYDESGMTTPASVLAQAERAVARETPGLHTAVVYTVDQPDGDEPTDIPFTNVVPGGCTVEETIHSGDSDAANARCHTYGTSGLLTPSGIGAIPADDLVRRLHLSAAQANAVRHGAVVVLGSAVPARMTFASGTYRADPDTGEPTSMSAARRVGAATVAVPATRANVLATSGLGVIATPETARSLGWGARLTPMTLLVTDPGGTVSVADQKRIDNALTGDAEFYVERGYSREDALVMAILVGAFSLLLLVITLTSTALSLAEQQADQSTLAALGATRGTRRAMAAAQSLVICAVGAVLGLVVGMVPGVAIAVPLTRTTGDETLCYGSGVCSTSGGHGAIIDIPWMWLAVAVIGIPLLAAAVSWVAVRRAPLVTRRAT
ncbi:conserved membrane hypothetical protein [Nostocoides japonicum T1-X7]|uniref:ABC3 transporter permease C-terminal domain-containing protein n=2 Tax=Nostocoides japonicum TaxID=99481 RepID=A0A077M251_9MICO|nr:conserved membrane hypothetical protein [Tetrasphaera japonica T1-X7]